MGLLSTNEELASYKPAKVSVLKSGREGESVARYSTADHDRGHTAVCPLSRKGILGLMLGHTKGG